MPRLILLVAIIAVIYILLRRAQGMPPHKRRGEYIKLALGVTVVLVIIATLAGRMHWVGAAFTGLLVAFRQLAPTLIRLFPMFSSYLGSNSASGGQTSSVASAILSMQLDHDSGALQGEVLQGTFKGWRLADMNKEQLLQLHEYCEREDSDSAQLLESYLEQRFPDQNHFQQNQRSTESAGDMSRSEALAVLGLADGASEEEIGDAHRKLMQKIHPDRGGSDYLAAKINQAKDVLLA